MKRTNQPQKGRQTSSVAKQMKRRAAAKPKKKEAPLKKVWTPERLIPSGCTLFNLACSDSIYGAWPIGRISTMPGSSASGKTVVALSSLAATAVTDTFKDYKLVLDDAENRMDFDLGYLFGDTLIERLEGPPLAEPDNDWELGCSDTIEDLDANISTLINQDKPFIYFLDSLDALTTREELEKQQVAALQIAKSPEDIKAVKEAFAGRKANLIGQMLRKIKKKMAKTNSALIIIQQLRINVNAGPFGKKYRTSGGEAPFFYSHMRPILRQVKTHKAKDIPIGVRTKMTPEKNSLTGKIRTIEFDIFYDLGIDNVGAMVDWLVSIKAWPKSGQKINAKQLGVQLTRVKLIKHIEDKDLEDKVARICQKVWTDFEKTLCLDRKRRFK